MTHSTNYFDTFIAASPDTKAIRGMPPKASTTPSIAMLTFQMLHERPYQLTSDDVIFGVYAERNKIPKSKRTSARKAFFAKGQPCLRASALAKTYGWGFHLDAEGRVALVGVDSNDYRAFVAGNKRAANGNPLTVKSAMRSMK